MANQCLSLRYSFFDFYSLVFINLILLCDDIGENAGPKTKPNDNLSVFHWNVNSISSHNVQKIAVLKNFIARHKAQTSYYDKFYWSRLSNILIVPKFIVNERSNKRTFHNFDI